MKGKSLIFILCFIISACIFDKQQAVLNMGTGNENGLYYPIGKFIGRIFAEQDRMTVNVLPSHGSSSNIQNVVEGKWQFGIAQADIVYHAFNRGTNWERLVDRSKLRTIMALHAESITLVASKGSKIISLNDLKGKKVNIGKKGAGQYQNATQILKYASIELSDITTANISSSQSPVSMKNGEIDAFFYTVGHPNTNIRRIFLLGEQARFIEIPEDITANLLKSYPYYTRVLIDKELYPESLNESSVNTVGVRSLLITSSEVDEDVVYKLTKKIFSQIEDLQLVHPATKSITMQTALESLTAPLHPGAKKFYQEKGLLPQK